MLSPAFQNACFEHFENQFQKFNLGPDLMRRTSKPKPDQASGLGFDVSIISLGFQVLNIWSGLRRFNYQV